VLKVVPLALWMSEMAVLMSFPLRAAAKRFVRTGAFSSTPAFVMSDWSLSAVMSTPSSARMRAAYEVASSDADVLL
jgi:hypothetical protein